MYPNDMKGNQNLFLDKRATYGLFSPFGHAEHQVASVRWREDCEQRQLDSSWLLPASREEAYDEIEVYKIDAGNQYKKKLNVKREDDEN